MERVRRLAQLWNRLPAFRVVAETEHLPTAARELHVSPSALSRAIKLLEDDLGRALFLRIHREIVLSDAGHRFLEAVRTAMRVLDDAVSEVTEALHAGPVHLLTSPPLHALFAVPLVRTLKRAQPQLVVHLRCSGERRAQEELCAGTADLCLLEAPTPAAGLVIERLGWLDHAVYCGAEHPLAGVPGPGLDALAPHPFVLVEDVGDAWPCELQRRIGAGVGTIHDALALCGAGEFLAFLPGELVHLHPLASRLHRLELTELAVRTPVYVQYRRPLGSYPRLEVVLGELRHLARALLAPRDMLPAQAAVQP
jgi:DNA-binding transcriptional LysR family regulator